MELGLSLQQAIVLKTIDISAHGQCVRAFFRVVSSLGIGMKAFAYAHTDAEVYFTAKTVD